jgi:RNA polymerase sigma factor (sigma-70 family)
MSSTVVRLSATAARAADRIIVLDEAGQPLTGNVALVLERLAPAFARQFDEFRDEAVLVDALERAALRIKRRVAHGGVINLEAYAWVTLVSIANSLRRRGQARLARRTVSESSGAALNVAVATIGSSEAIERSILIRELLAHLSPRERAVYELRLAGLTSQEIAECRGCTAGAVDVLFTRVHRRLRQLLNPGQSPNRATAQFSRQSVTARRRERRHSDMPAALLAPTTGAPGLIEL